MAYIQQSTVIFISLCLILVWTSAVPPNGIQDVNYGAPKLQQQHARATLARASSRKYNNPFTVDNLFTLRMYRTLSNANDGNLLFSPISVITTLSALLEGANGTTYDEILQSMNRTRDGMQLHKHAMSRALDALGKNSPTHVLNVASRMFVQQEYYVTPAYQEALRSTYKMEAVGIDFTESQAAENVVNRWVAHVTSQRITSLIPPGTLDLQTRLVLANAIFFKGEWDTMFDEKNTRLRPFHTRKNKTVQVPMMTLEADFPYADYFKLGFEMLELPYVGDEVSMFVVLPYEDQTLAQVARRLLHRPYLLTDPRRKLYSNRITVILPKFNLEEEVDLKETLFAMGVRQAFEQGRADLSGINGNKELYVSNALHKAVIEVNEKGTKAAAATAMVLKGRSMRSDPVFHADRPFLFFIRHNPTSTVLFLGHVKTFKNADAASSSRQRFSE